jgi:hypothetical protein
VGGSEIHEARCSPGGDFQGGSPSVHVINFDSSHVKTFSTLIESDGVEKHLPVLNVSYNEHRPAVDIKPNHERALIIFRDGVWHESNTELQMDFLTQYFDRIVATKIKRGTQRPMSPPLVVPSSRLESELGTIQHQVRKGELNLILFFDMSPQTTDLQSVDFHLDDVKISDSGHTLLDLIPDESDCKFLILGIFTKRYSSLNHENLARHLNLVAEKVLDERKVILNFIFPTESYDASTCFSFEFAAVANFIEAAFEEYRNCAEALSSSQNSICERAKTALPATSPLQRAVANSSLFYIPQRLIQLEPEEKEFMVPARIEPFSARIKQIKDYCDDPQHAGGFPIEVCNRLDELFQQIFQQSINLVNDLARNGEGRYDAEFFSMAMGIAFQTKFSFDNRTGEEIVGSLDFDTMILQLFAEYKEEEQIPFPENLFRYKSGNRMASMKAWGVMKDVRGEPTNNLAAFFAIYVYELLAEEGHAAPPLLDDCFRQTDAAIKEVQEITQEEEFRRVLPSQRSPFGIFVLDARFAKCLEAVHRRFHKTHEARLVRNRVGIAEYQDLWYPQGTSYVMRPESVNEGLRELNKLLETYCNMESKNYTMWGLQQHTNFVHQEAAWLKKLNDFLEADLK